MTGLEKRVSERVVAGILCLLADFEIEMTLGGGSYGFNTGRDSDSTCTDYPISGIGI
jgi:hypothetical protein